MAVRETVTLPSIVLDQMAVDAFATRLRGQLLRPGDEPYEPARRVWNGNIDRWPALIVRCAGVADVIAAVHFCTGQPACPRGARRRA